MDQAELPIEMFLFDSATCGEIAIRVFAIVAGKGQANQTFGDVVDVALSVGQDRQVRLEV